MDQKKRKNEEEEEVKKRKKIPSKYEQLLEVVRLIDQHEFEEAQILIPPEDRHLPLFVSRPFKVWPGMWPLLTIAVKRGAYRIAEYLLDGGANIEVKETRVRREFVFIHILISFILVW